MSNNLVKGDENTPANIAQVQDKSQQKQPKVQQKVQTEVNAAQPATDPFKGCNAEEITTLKLIEQQLDEYASKTTRASQTNSAEVIERYNKLHAAFRGMMGLRGAAHKVAARYFLKAFNKYGTTALDYDMRCRNLDMLGRDWSVVFTSYMDALNRFSRCDEKANFRKMHDIDRLISKIADKELADSINAVFP